MESATHKYRTLLVFQVGLQDYGISSSDVQQITAMAELHRPPAMPKVLAGFLNLAGEPIPVVHLRKLFCLPNESHNLWTPLVILRRSSRPLGLLVDRVRRVLRVEHEEVLPLAPGHVLNDCVEGILRRAGEASVLLLSPERLLLQQEAESVDALQRLAQQRLRELEGAQA